jgi:glutamine amidotransferase-like uncharacterized protein
MKNTFKLFVLLTTLSSALSAQAKKVEKPLALVWAGPGVCKPSCLADATNATKKAGFQVLHVKPELKDFSVFEKAKLWVQPGGKSVTAARSMSPELKDSIRSFIHNGAGYVGFCAGAFISTGKIGTSGEEGFGIIPGDTELLIKEGKEDLMLKVWTKDFGSRWMLYAGGPFLHVSEAELAEVDGVVTSRYPDGSVAGIQGHYGKGRVAVTGFHPEASRVWKLFYKLWDKDGSDVFFAVDMMKYATSQK